MSSILDPAFKYTSSAGTDIRKTFAKFRREQARAQQNHKPRTAAVLPAARTNITKIARAT